MNKHTYTKYIMNNAFLNALRENLSSGLELKEAYKLYGQILQENIDLERDFKLIKKFNKDYAIELLRSYTKYFSDDEWFTPYEIQEHIFDKLPFKYSKKLLNYIQGEYYFELKKQYFDLEKKKKLELQARLDEEQKERNRQLRLEREKSVEEVDK